MIRGLGSGCQFGGVAVAAQAPAPSPEPNLRPMQNQRNELAEKPRLNEAERKEMNVLNRIYRDAKVWWKRSLVNTALDL